jgi:hypothetical protein
MKHLKSALRCAWEKLKFVLLALPSSIGFGSTYWNFKISFKCIWQNVIT